MLRFRPVLFLVLAGAVTSMAATSIFPRWVRHEGGRGGSSGDWISNLQRDGFGNLYLTGFFFSDTVIANTPLDATSSGYFVVKYSPDGAPLWVRQTSGGGIAVDPVGNLYEYGAINGSITIGATNLYRTNGSSYLTKYSPAGDVLWVRQMGGTNDYPGISAMAANTNTVFVSGGYRGVGKFGATNLPSTADVDLFLAKFSSAGVLRWVRSEAAPTEDYAASMALLPDGGCTIATMHNYAVTNSALRRYHAGGALLWARGLVLPVGYPTLAVDPSTNIYLASSFEYQAAVGGPIITNLGQQNFDLLCARFTGDGTFVWARHVGGRGDDRVNGLAIAPSGRVCIAGGFGYDQTYAGTTTSFSGMVLTNPTPGTWSGFLAEYDSSGALQLLAIPAYAAEIKGLAVQTNGEWAVAGMFNREIDVGGSHLVSRGLYDIYVAQFTTNLVEAPAIAVTPVSHVAARGESVVLSATATPNLAVTFQWQLDGTNLPGATNATLLVSEITTNHSGLYSVILHSDCCTVVNSSFRLKVNPVTELPWPGWLTRSVGTNHSAVRALAVNQVGECYVAGEFLKHTTLGTNVLGTTASYATYVAKLSSSGQVLWAHSLSPVSLSLASCFDGRLGPDDSFYVTTFFPTQVMDDRGQSFPRGLLLSKYDSAGNLVWVRAIDTTNMQGGASMALAPNGHLFVAANCLGRVGFGSTNLDRGPIYSSFVAEYDSAGTFLSLRLTDYVTAITVTSNHVYLGASTIAKLDAAWNPLWSAAFPNSSARRITVDDLGQVVVLVGDGYNTDTLAKFSPQGSNHWSRTFDLSGRSDMALDRFGNILVVGTMQYYRSIGGNWFSSLGGLDSDVFLLQCDAFGTLGSVRQLGGTLNDGGYRVARGLDDAFYVGGYLSGDVYFGNGVSFAGKASESFIACLGAVNNLHPPRLQAISDAPYVNVSWRSSSTNWRIEAASQPDGSYSPPAVSQASRTGQTNTVRVPAAASEQHFRLRRVP